MVDYCPQCGHPIPGDIFREVLESSENNGFSVQRERVECPNCCKQLTRLVVSRPVLVKQCWDTPVEVNNG